jgi:hypothetical protein
MNIYIYGKRKKAFLKFRLPRAQAPFRVGRVLCHHLICKYMVPYFPRYPKRSLGKGEGVGEGERGGEGEVEGEGEGKEEGRGRG